MRHQWPLLVITLLAGGCAAPDDPPAPEAAQHLEARACRPVSFSVDVSAFSFSASVFCDDSGKAGYEISVSPPHRRDLKASLSTTTLDPSLANHDAIVNGMEQLVEGGHGLNEAQRSQADVIVDTLLAQADGGADVMPEEITEDMIDLCLADETP